MKTIGELCVSLCDPLNPEFGYQVKIHDDRGKLLLLTSRNPVTGKDLWTYKDALEVAYYYQ